MTQARDEAVQLLNDDTDDAFIIVPIDTREILRRLDENNLDHLQTTLPKLEAIQIREKAKSALPVGAAVFALAVVGASAYWLSRFLSWPSPKEMFYQPLGPRPDFRGKYLNTSIPGLNETCGARFADTEIFTTDYQHDDKNYCQRAIWRLRYEIQWFVDSCSAYSITDYCNYRAIHGYMLDCFEYARDNLNCLTKEGMASYLNLTIRDVLGGSAPLERCSSYYTPDPVAGCEIWNDRYLWRTDRPLFCASEAKLICDLNISTDKSFTSPIPGFNESCADRYISRSVFEYCGKAASVFASEQYNWDHLYQEKDGWWNVGRTMILLGTLAATIILFGLSLYLFFKGTSLLQQKKKISELPDNDDLLRAMDLYLANADRLQATIDDAFEKLTAYKENGKAKEEKLLADMRRAFVSSEPKELPIEIRRIVLHGAGLFQHPPAEKMYVAVTSEPLKKASI